MENLKVMVIVGSGYFLTDLVFFRFHSSPLFNPFIQMVSLLAETALSYLYIMLFVEIVAYV